MTETTQNPVRAKTASKTTAPKKGEGDSLKEALSQKDECQKGCA